MASILGIMSAESNENIEEDVGLTTVVVVVSSLVVAVLAAAAVADIVTCSGNDCSFSVVDVEVVLLDSEFNTLVVLVLEVVAIALALVLVSVVVVVVVVVVA